jgi:predicted nucleic acid-binding protein
MKYLLDVNALIALGIYEHIFHRRVTRWLEQERFQSLGTCSITELGFVRILSQSAVNGLNIAQALDLLLEIKRGVSPPLVFLPDDHHILRLPGWVNHPRQTTDGHLLKLAASHGATLATLDANIPGAFLIP